MPTSSVNSIKPIATNLFKIRKRPIKIVGGVSNPDLPTSFPHPHPPNTHCSTILQIPKILQILVQTIPNPANPQNPANPDSDNSPSSTPLLKSAKIRQIRVIRDLRRTRLNATCIQTKSKSVHSDNYKIYQPTTYNL